MDIFGLGLPELLLILFMLLLFFGKDKLPELASSIGRSFRELKEGFEGGIRKGTEDTDKVEKLEKEIKIEKIEKKK